MPVAAIAWGCGAAGVAVVVRSGKAINGMVKQRKSASEYVAQPRASDAATAHAGRPVAGMMR